jgi:hypothetical protein
MENNLQPLNDKTSLEDLKSYYQREVVSPARDASEPRLLSPDTDSPDWANTLFSSEKNIYIIPVKMKVTRTNKDLIISKYLLITGTNAKKSGYFYYTISDKMKANTAISPQQLLNSINPANSESAELKKTGYTLVKAPLHETELFVKERDISASKSGNYISRKKGSRIQKTDTGSEASFAPVAGCEDGGILITIDWYYQYYVNGELIYETYVFSTTECSGIGSGGGSGGDGTSEADCSNRLTNVAYSAVSCSDLISTSTLAQSSFSRTIKYEWKILKNLGWYISSFEKGTHYKDGTSGTWKWKALEHLNVVVVGSVYGVAIEPSVVSQLPEIGVYDASMDLGLDVKYSLQCSGSPMNITLSYNVKRVFKLPNTVTPEA